MQKFTLTFNTLLMLIVSLSLLSCSYKQTEIDRNFGKSINNAKLKQRINMGESGNANSKELSSSYNTFQNDSAGLPNASSNSSPMPSSTSPAN
jgi:hypothetical protein